jgi:N-terminal domain of galactosyltransferase
MRDVFVVIPWNGSTDIHRKAAFDYVLAAHGRLGFPIILADSEPFSRAKALNRTIQTLPPGAVIVQADADALLPQPVRYSEAIRAASETHGLVIPHDRYLFLNERSTDDLLSGQLGPRALTEDHCDEHGGFSVSLVVVYSRETWRLAHGYDERFTVWGGEDAAFAYAAGALAGEQRRLTGDVVHLFHPRPPESDPSSQVYKEQFTLLEPYRDAAAIGNDAVAELVRNRPTA